MTAREMQRKVEQRLLSLEIDKNKLKSQDIFDALNLQQHVFISNRLDSIRQNNADNFAAIQKEIDDLRLLIEDSSAITATSNTSPKAVYPLPAQYRHFIRAKVQVTKGECSPVYRSIRMYDQHILDDILEERLYRTSAKSPVGSLIGNNLNVYFEGFSLGNAIITHIKAPAVIGITNNAGVLTEVNCSLAESTHEDIVELAVQYAYRVLNISQPQNN